MDADKLHHIEPDEQSRFNSDIRIFQLCECIDQQERIGNAA